MFDLKQFRKDNKISQKELAEKLGVVQSFISQIENGKDPMPESMLIKISVIYKDVQLAKYQRVDINNTEEAGLNAELGDMSKEIILDRIRKLIENGELGLDLISSKTEGGLTKTTNKDLKLKEYGSYVPVKLVSTAARAGFAGAYYSDEYLNDMPTVLMEADQEYKGKYLAFEVDGDSMEPEYIKGDVVICREVKRDLWQYKLHIHDWDFVIAHGSKGIMLKEIIDHDTETGEIVCHSINTNEHPDFKLNLKEVAYLYNVVEVRRSGRSKRRNR